MARFDTSFDATSVEPTTAYELLPAGKYRAQIVESEMRVTKNGMGQFLWLVQRFDPEITGHGFRATFKGWARSQRRYQKDAIEFALAHGLPPLEAAYFREDLLEERRPMMQDWADFVCEGAGARKIADGGQ